MPKPHQLIWFQHFHKAAGTTIVEYAKLNGLKLWPQHINGNPLNNDGRQIELWKYSNTQLAAFIDECDAANVTFVATEWGMPNIDTLTSDPRVRLITCLRDPLSRFVSNFYFDLHHGFTAATSLIDYMGSRNRTITMDNYYCRILSAHNNNPDPVTQPHYETAVSNLAAFDLVLILEDGFSGLAEILEWNVSDLHSNRSDRSARHYLSPLIRGNWRQLYHRLRYPMKPVDVAFRKIFEVKHSWDIALMDRAVDRFSTGSINQ